MTTAPSLTSSLTSALSSGHSSPASRLLRAVRTCLVALGWLALTALGVGTGSAWAQTATTTVLTSQRNPTTTSDLSLYLTATITGTSPTGTVTFKDGTTTIGTASVSSASAQLLTRFNSTGSHNLTAVYSGDTANSGSTSAVLVQIVNLVGTTTSIASSVNPSTVGQSTILTATVSPNTATGTVTFKDGATTLVTAPLSPGGQTYPASFSALGSHSLTAVYNGDAYNSPSTSAVLVQNVNLPATTTSIASSVNPSIVGQTTALTATVSPSTAMGTVTFKDGATTLGTGTLALGVAGYNANLSTLGSHSLTAVYNGDTANSGSTSAVLVQTVNPKTVSTTALTSSVNPTIVGQVSILTATVTGSSPTGTITFKDGATTLNTASLSGGVASISASFTATGARTLTAVYAGDTANNGSTSASTTQTVNTGAATLPAPPSAPAPVARYEYDAQGNPTKTIQAPGVSGFNFATIQTYDTLSRQKNTTNAKSGLTQFGYNGREDLIKVTDPRNLITQYPRNGLGDATSVVSPDTGTAPQTYDAAGNLKTRTDSRGVLATYSYDALNRLTGIAYTQSGQVTLTYVWTYDQTGTGFSNGVGRLTSTSFPDGTTQYTYDAQGRLLTNTQRIAANANANISQISTTVGYTYDAAGNITSVTYPSGRKLSVTYTNGLPSTLALGKDALTTPVNLISSIQWEPFGGVKSWLWQIGAGTAAYNRVFDANGRLVRYPLGGFMRDISYDAADRITGYTHYEIATGTATAAATALNQSFTYDELARLTGVSAAGSSWTIAYDANGNRTSTTLNGTTRAYTTPATSNKLSGLTNPARSLGYDVAGNITSDSASYATGNSDLAGRLSLLINSGVFTFYSYDGSGQRLRKFASSGATSTVIFVYDQGGQLLGEYSNTGAAIREYVWLGNTPVAVFTPDPANVANPPLVYYIHTDHLNTPRVVLNTANVVRWNWLAEPFGTTAPNTNPSGAGPFTFNLRFPGQYADSEAGLLYNMARYYDPSIGRYTQSDPIGLAGGINTYSYVGGNPLSYVDPTGQNVAVGARLGGAAGGAIGGPPGAVIGATLGALGGYLIADRMSNLSFAKPGNESRPTNAPPGTVPINETGLGRGDVHDIKDGVGAGPRDWTGIAPDGHVITSDPSGRAVDHGPVDQFTHRPTGLCPTPRGNL